VMTGDEVTFLGYVNWLTDGENEFPAFMPSADTDMTLIGIGALTSTKRNEIVITKYDLYQPHNDAQGRAVFEASINKLLGRNDLRVVPLLRVEDRSPGPGLSFQEFRTLWKPPILFYGSIYRADKEATVVREMSIEEYRAQGGAISLFGAGRSN